MELPEISHVRMTVSDDIRIPEGYIEKEIEKMIGQYVMKFVDISYNEHPLYQESTDIQGNFVVMSVKDRDRLYGYVKHLEELVGINIKIG